MHDEPIGNGRTAEVIGYDETSVLKRFRPFMKREYIEREFRAASFAFSQKVATPQPVRIIQDAQGTGIVYRRIAGKSMLQALSENPMALSRITRLMARLHFDMHRIEYNDEGNAQKRNLTAAVEAVEGITDRDKRKILEYLRTLPDGDRLCHNDFHPDNIMMDGGLWIIDWMTGSSGSPECDVARSKMILETSEIPPSVPFPVRQLLRLGQRKIARVYVREYRKLGKLRKGDIDRWLLPLYAARLSENLSDRETRTIQRLMRKEMRRLGL